MKLKLSQLKEVKNLLLDAVSSLPDYIFLPPSEKSETIRCMDVSADRAKTVMQIRDFWEFFEQYGQFDIVTLVGMVNVGKSAIGNILLGRGISEVFSEGAIRETAEAGIAITANNFVVIDLPGLGSVEANTDDLIVSNYVNRANLLLIILAINQPIPRHLYDFLKSDRIIKDGRIQRVIFVVNKSDIYQGAPPEFQEEQFEQYRRFLWMGDDKNGFPGTHDLFNYHIPIISFSVNRVRTALESTEELESEIFLSLAGCEGGQTERVAKELSDILQDWIYLKHAYDYFYENGQKLSKSKEAEIVGLEQGVANLILKERNTFVSNFNAIVTSSWQEFGRLERPSWLSQKLNLLSYYDDIFDRTKREYIQKGNNALDAFVKTMTASLKTLIDIRLEAEPEIKYVPQGDIAIAITEYFYRVCDACKDDYVKGTPYNSWHEKKIPEAGKMVDQALNDFAEAYCESLSWEYRRLVGKRYDDKIKAMESAADELKKTNEALNSCKSYFNFQHY